MMNPPPTPTSDDHLHFVTGKLAQQAVRDIVDQLASQYGFAYSIDVLPITVAALMTPKWIGRHLNVPQQTTHIVVPGYCETGLDALAEAHSVVVLRGPKDCRELPEWFGGERQPIDLSDHSIEIIAEINHVPRQSIDNVVATAKRMVADGADRIDLGCDPSTRCPVIGDYVAALTDIGITTSIDTFDSWEAQQAVARGASLVLSVNSSNRQAAVDWGVEVVAIPDAPGDSHSLENTVQFLDSQGVAMRLDPILEPIGAGLAESLVRYADVRRKYPNRAMMMGIGNLTELTDVDSAGVNLILLGICQELGIQSVLTTEVTNWSRSSVKECDIARRMTHFAVRNGVPPKRLCDQLVQLRDPKLRDYPDSGLADLAESLKDNNYRLFAQRGQLHLIAANTHLTDSDPFHLFDQLMKQPVSSNVDPGHAFYLGYELAKASIALQLGKQYNQDQGLHWGHLTVEEDLHRLERKRRSQP
ncbi:MAG: DUF6513 domain-containing protein [Planctomycetota bacterium]